MSQIILGELTKQEAFEKELIKRVRSYFKTQNKSIHSNWVMNLKLVCGLSLLVLTYLLLVFTHGSLFYKLGLATFLSLVMLGVGFNVTHDANHFAIAKYKWINLLIGSTMDVLGLSSCLWRLNHNNLHHRYPNVFNYDIDLDLSYFLRLTPYQQRRWFHAYQIYYMWVLFLFAYLFWHWVSDTINLIKKIKHKPPLIKKAQIVQFFIGKIIFCCLAFGIPVLFYPLATVLTFYFIIYGISGLIAPVIVLLAHINEEASFFPAVDAVKPHCNESFCYKQMNATVNFSMHNRFLFWYIGGLNFQIEHHLFPYICHVHYPEISLIVQDVCKEFDIPYKYHRTFYLALHSSYQWLKYLGKYDNDVLSYKNPK